MQNFIQKPCNNISSQSQGILCCAKIVNFSDIKAIPPKFITYFIKYSPDIQYYVHFNVSYHNKFWPIRPLQSLYKGEANRDLFPS